MKISILISEHLRACCEWKGGWGGGDYHTRSTNSDRLWCHREIPRSWTRICGSGNGRGREVGEGLLKKMEETGDLGTICSHFFTHSERQQSPGSCLLHLKSPSIVCCPEMAPAGFWHIMTSLERKRRPACKHQQKLSSSLIVLCQPDPF